MRKKILSTILVITMLFAFAIPALAITNVDHDDFNDIALRAIIVEQTSSVATLVANILPADTIKEAIKTAVSGMLDLDDVSKLAGPALAGLLGNAAKNSLGLAIPDSVDLESIVNSVLSSDIVSSIVTSGFVSKVIDRTIDNLINALVVEDAINALADSVVDQLTAEIWNDANPNSGSFLGIQTGHWNTNGGWNKTNIGITIAAKLGIAGVSGNIEDYIDVDNIDLTKIFSVETLLGAVTKAITDTSKEYFEAYKAALVAKVQAKIEELKTLAKNELVNELNKIFGLKLAARDDFDAIEAKITTFINESKSYIDANRDKIIREVKALQTAVKTLDKYSCLDLGKVNSMLDRLLKCLEKKEKPVIPTPDPILDSVSASAVVEKQNGNQNKLTITVTEKFKDGTTKTYTKSFQINNNAAGTYEVGAYKVYVNTKGNTQIRECYIVA
ncbi:MAG: hypothetical protein FWH33_01585 [Oscillospiraceae bacterium]|nr:hypothetical protein [Oscillospiraceae bacterium]